jgi:exodeoxyribonuclease-1
MENADKRSVQRRLDAGGVFGLIVFGKILPVAGLMTSPSNPSSMAVADLGIEPSTYLDLSQADLADAIAASGVRPIRSVKLNAQPLLLPWDNVRAAAGQSDVEEAMHRTRLRQINRHDSFWKTLPSVLAKRYAHREPSVWPEGRLYDRFVSGADARACQTWHHLAWEQRIPFAAENIADDRLRAFANRMAFLEARHCLSLAALRGGCAWLGHRLTTADNVPWLTLPAGIARCEALRAKTDDRSVQHRLDEISAWFAERLARVQAHPGTDLSLAPPAHAAS